MPNLTTTYLGLKLKNPIVPSSSPWMKKLENIQRMEEAGAAAVVLHSLFEEQITRHQLDLLAGKLGRAVLTELGDVNDLHKPAVEQAGFAVLKAPDIPSILVETAFISNPDEERRLKDAGYQDKVAGAVMAGIKRYLAGNPPLSRVPRTAAVK